MTFASPSWLWALAVLPIVAAVEVWGVRRDRERTARFAARELWARVVRRPAEGWRFLRLGLLLAGVAGLVLALARPQWGIVRERVEREGVDVVLALDTSGSMATEDVPPNRFFLARAALANLVARLEGDRFGLLAFEGEAYPLVPLTLDADAISLFLETVEPGTVPAPGTSLGVGLARGLEMFVDRERRHKVLVLVSDGEDLEGEVEEAVRRAKEAGVIVHTVGVGTERGEPVPDFDREGQRVGFKKDSDGSAVVSRLHPETLEAVARGTGGRFFRVTAADASLSGLAAAIEGMEHRALAREYSYRKKERFQVPLAIGLGALTLGFSLPLPWPRSRLRSQRVLKPAAAIAACLLAGSAYAQAPPATAEPPSATAPNASPSPAAPPPKASASRSAAGRVLDELLLRPTRLTAKGRTDYARGDHPGALQAFEDAAAARPDDPRARFNVAAGLYKNGKFDEAAALWRALRDDARSPLAAASRFNLGNSLFQKQDYPGAVGAYRDALRVAPRDEDTRRNLELALRALQQQQEQQQRAQNQQQRKQDQQDRQGQGQRQQDPQKQDAQRQQARQGAERPKTEQQKEQERFQKETGMPKERAMQLLDALQRNEKAEQKKLLAAKAKKKEGRDW